MRDFPACLIRRKMEGNGSNGLLKKLFLQLMAVNILAGLVQPFNQFTDSALTGKGLGADALGAYALFLPVGAFVFAAGSFFSIGTQISCSHLLGEGKTKEARNFAKTAFVSATCFSVFLAALIIIFPEQLAVILGAAGNAQIRSTGSYLSAYAAGIPSIFLVSIMMSLLQLEGKKRMVVMLSFCILIINAAGDLLNLYVFGKGLAGMAMATAVSNIVVFLILLYHFLFKSGMFRFSLKEFSFFEFITMVKNGLPSMTYYGSLVIRALFFNYIILTKLDGSVLAVMAAVNGFTAVVDAAIGGTGDTVLLLGGVLYGEKNLKGGRDLLKAALLYGSMLLLFITVLSVIFAGTIAEIFANGEDIWFTGQAAVAIRLTSLCFVPDVMACVLKKHIQAVGRAAYTSVTNVLCNVFYVGLSAIILTGISGFKGLFLSFLTCYLLVLLTHIAYAFALAGKHGRKGFDILMFLPDDFDISDDDMREFCIRDINECMDVSRRVYDICMERTVEKSRCYHLSLFVEETAKNIIEHGFQRAGNNQIVVRLLFLKDAIRLNFRDDCPLFDPKAYYDLLMENKESFSGFGIRIVMGAARKVSYTNSFRLNNLLIDV